MQILSKKLIHVTPYPQIILKKSYTISIFVELINYKQPLKIF